MPTALLWGQVQDHPTEHRPLLFLFPVMPAGDASCRLPAEREEDSSEGFIAFFFNRPSQGARLLLKCATSCAQLHTSLSLDYPIPSVVCRSDNTACILRFEAFRCIAVPHRWQARPAGRIRPAPCFYPALRSSRIAVRE